MKKGILLLFVVLMGFTSCGKKFGHRYLDGMWQMQRIEYKDGNIDTPLDTYFSFQMDIIHLRKLGNSEFYGKYVYENDSMHIQSTRRYGGTDESFRHGWPGTGLCRREAEQ